MSLRALQKHLASHQQQLSLFALPTNLDEREDDEDEEDRRSQGMQESDDDNISNFSAFRDADESSTLKIPWRTVEYRVHVRFPAYDDFAWANIERYLRQKWPSWNDFKPCRLGQDWTFQVPEQLTEVHKCLTFCDQD
jgi:hypothetical protein